MVQRGGPSEGPEHGQDHCILGPLTIPTSFFFLGELATRFLDKLGKYMNSILIHF